MADNRDVYEQLVPAHAREPEILVTREHLAMFPPVGHPFQVLVGNRRCRSQIVARRCFCAGPDSPHEHYYVDLTELGKLLDWGTFSKVRIRKLRPDRFQILTRG